MCIHIEMAYKLCERIAKDGESCVNMTGFEQKLMCQHACCIRIVISGAYTYVHICSLFLLSLSLIES